jgi:gas vesicle protein
LRHFLPYATVCVEVTMADNVGSKVTYFLVGLGVGALMGVLFAPKSGEETRDFLAKRADDGREFAQKKARELRERADELIERGKDVASRKRDSLTAAVEAGREAFLRESKS